MQRKFTALGFAFVTGVMAFCGEAQAAGTSGPVMPIPNPMVVAPLSCTNKVVAYGRSVDVTNSLNTTLAKGKVISWSYRYKGGGGQAWPTPAEGRVKTGSTTLTASLAPGQSVRIDMLNKVYSVSECKASVPL